MVTLTQTLQSFSGPMPPPDLLERYEAIVPGSAGRLLDLHEGQTHHRQGLEQKVIDGKEKRATRGQWMAFVLLLAVLSVCGYLVAIDKLVLASVVITVNVSIYGAVNIIGRLSEKGERERKFGMLG